MNAAEIPLGVQVNGLRITRDFTYDTSSMAVPMELRVVSGDGSNSLTYLIDVVEMAAEEMAEFYEVEALDAQTVQIPIECLKGPF